MALLPALFKKKLIFLTLIAALFLIGNVAASSFEDNANKSENKASLVNHTQTEKQQKTFKKDLKVNITALNLEPVTVQLENNDHTEKLVIMDEKSVIETAVKAGEPQVIEEKQTPVAQKGIEKSNLLMASPTRSLSATEVGEHHHGEEEFLIQGDDNDLDSLKTGFYFFLIVSSGAVIFITFKIYRLRLSRAERKYGVHGDRTAQELTPLPISIEDGHSDDEDQTLFEMQRQNVRIL